MVQGLKIRAEISVDIISSPGTLISDKNGDLFLSIKLFKTTFRSIDYYPYFPLIIRSKFECQKLCEYVSDPEKLSKILENEKALIELYQGENLLAFYTSSVRKFLFPKIPIKTYTDSDRELLLFTTNHYKGTLQPKIEFGTSVTIEETYIRPKLTGRLNDCNMVTVIDDRIYFGKHRKEYSRNKSKQIGTDPSSTGKSSTDIDIEHSSAYTNLHNRIRAALVNNQEKNFKVKQKERSPKEPIVYLSKDTDWSASAAQFRGQNYRKTFDAAIYDIYDDLLNHHEKNSEK